MKSSRPRESIPFNCSVSCGVPALAKLAAVPLDHAFQDFDAIVEAYEIGRPRAETLFGPGVAFSPPGWAPISYGHVNVVGCPLIFPEDSEVAHQPIHLTLAAGVAALQAQRDLDFTRAGLFPRFLELFRRLKDRYPGLAVSMRSLGYEGPITTAWALRGHDFFYDFHDEPELSLHYLRLVTDSIVEYVKVLRRVDGREEIFDGDVSTDMADDLSAMLRPELWSRFVLPFHERFYASLTTGWREAHIEGLTAQHLPFLDQLGLDAFDPSVSPQLTPDLLRDHSQVPFRWRLNCMQLTAMDEKQVADWVRAAVRGGASGLFCVIEPAMCNAASAAKVRAFLRAGAEVGKGQDRNRAETRGPGPRRHA